MVQPSCFSKVGGIRGQGLNRQPGACIGALSSYGDVYP